MFVCLFLAQSQLASSPYFKSLHLHITPHKTQGFRKGKTRLAGPCPNRHSSTPTPPHSPAVGRPHGRRLKATWWQTSTNWRTPPLSTTTGTLGQVPLLSPGLNDDDMPRAHAVPVNPGPRKSHPPVAPIPNYYDSGVKTRQAHIQPYPSCPPPPRQTPPPADRGQPQLREKEPWMGEDEGARHGRRKSVGPQED